MGQVFAEGSALPGVRVELNPTALNKYGIGLKQVRGVLSSGQREHSQGAFFGRLPRCGKWAPTIRFSRPWITGR